MFVLWCNTVALFRVKTKKVTASDISWRMNLFKTLAGCKDHKEAEIYMLKIVQSIPDPSPDRQNPPCTFYQQIAFPTSLFQASNRQLRKECL